MIDVLWLVLLLVLALIGYLVWPAITGVPRTRGLSQRMNAVLTLDEKLERLETTTTVVEETLAEVRTVVGDLAATIAQLNASLVSLDVTMHGVAGTTAKVEKVADRAIPLLNALELVTGPVTAVSRAAGRVRRTGQSEQPAIVAGDRDLSADETLVIRAI